MTTTSPTREARPATTLPDPWSTPTLSVPDAGRLVFGIGRGGAYAAARAGTLPVVSNGRRVRVPTSWVYEALGLPIPARPTA